MSEGTSTNGWQRHGDGSLTRGYGRNLSAEAFTSVSGKHASLWIETPEDVSSSSCLIELREADYPSLCRQMDRIAEAILVAVRLAVAETGAEVVPGGILEAP